MKAVRLHSFGDASVLQHEECPKPVIGPNDVLLEMRAAALNHLDVWVRSGARERNIPLPHTPGCDGSGIIAEVGSAVSGLAPGDKVLVSPGLACGHCAQCLAGTDNLCREYRVIGVRDSGTYAEFVKLPAVNVVPIPEGLNFTEAAAVPLVFLTAWHMLVTLARIREGETVLVHGAGSGVGSAAIQIAKHVRAHVITTAGSDEKLRKAAKLGADETINYGTHDFADEVRRLTGKRGVDVVFEHVGGKVFEQSIPVLARGGRLVTCGATTEFTANVDIRYIYSRHQSIFGSWMGTKSELIRVMDLFRGDASTRSLQPVIDSVFPLADAAKAHRHMEERRNFGKIVLTI